MQVQLKCPGCGSLDDPQEVETEMLGIPGGHDVTYEWHPTLNEDGTCPLGESECNGEATHEEWYTGETRVEFKCAACSRISEKGDWIPALES